MSDSIPASIKPGTPLGGHDTKANNAAFDKTNRFGTKTDAWETVVKSVPPPLYKSKKARD